MTWDRSDELRNEANDAQLANIGSGSKIQFRTGAKSLVASGSLLWEVTLAAGFSASASGAASLSGVPLTALCSATGTIGHVRITKTDGTTGALAGTVTVSGGGGDVELTAASLAVVLNQPIDLNSLTFTENTPSV